MRPRIARGGPGPKFAGAVALFAVFALACRVTFEYQTPTAVAGPATTPAAVTALPTFAPPTPLSPTPTPTPAPIYTLVPTALPPAGPTPAPTATPTPTSAVPVVTVSENLNVRTGPGVNYPRLGLLAAGETVAVIGQNSAQTWWQIVYPDSASGLAWISAAYGSAQHTEHIPVVDAPSSPTPAIPTATPTPTVPPVDFVVKRVRLWSNEENGGESPNGSATNCGYGQNIFVTVMDAAGNPLDGVVLEDSYKTLRQITGSRGPGRAEYVFWGNGYQLQVIEDQSAGRAVTSQLSPLMSPKDEEIPIPWLIEAHYCATEAECQDRADKNLLCRGHYSFDIVFQRTW